MLVSIRNTLTYVCVLFVQCKQMVTGGHLPVILDEAIFISSLQLHIEVSTQDLHAIYRIYSGYISRV